MKTLFRYNTAVLAALIILGFSALDALAAQMSDYCTVPLYVRAGVDPNIAIVMDNDEDNQGPAYTADNTQVYSGVGTTGYDPNKGYYGLFRSGVWYSYSSNRFVPDTNGIFDGNLLNWAATSGYDLIQSILIGGKSTSRQTNVNTLQGQNDGTWEIKTFIYNGTNGTQYACDFRVNKDGSNKLTIEENRTYVFDNGKTCSLINGVNIRPGTGYYYTKYASAGDLDFDTMYASSANDDAPRLADRSLGIVNSLMGGAAGIAYAAADPCKGQSIKITSPTSGQALPQGNQYSVYTGFSPSTQEGNGINTWTVTGLPSGMLYDSTSGLIYNTPSASGIFNTTFTVKNTCPISASPAIANSASVTASLTINPSISVLYINTPTAGSYLSDALRNAVYNGAEASATGGTKPYTWTATGLPAGLSILTDTTTNTGVIYGTPTAAAGEYAVTITVTDSSATPLTASVTVNIRVREVSAASTLAITSNHCTLDYIVMFEAEYFNGYGIRADGGTKPYTWSSSWLPVGTSIASTGTNTASISGTPITVIPVGWVCNSGPITITVTDSVLATASKTLNWYSCEPNYSGWGLYCPSSGSTLPSAEQGKEYGGATMSAWYGESTHTWRATGLPTGMSINNTTGLIGGTPTASVGTYTSSVCVSKLDDESGARYETCSTYYIPVTLTSLGALMINSPSGASLPDAYQGEPYQGYTPAAQGGGGGYTWSATNLPQGMSIDSYTGYISGSPAEDPSEADYTNSVTITVTDRWGNTASVTVNLTCVATPWTGVNQSFVIQVCAAIDPEDGNPYTQNCTDNSGAEYKEGILQLYIDDARFGLLDFAGNTGDVTNNAECVDYQDPPSSYYTAVENANPTSLPTKLVDGMFQAVNMFVWDPHLTTGSSSDISATCNPYDEVPCRRNFVLMLTGGNGWNGGTNDAEVAADASHPFPSRCQDIPASLDYRIVRNACFGYNSDLNDLTAGATERAYIYVVNISKDAETYANQDLTPSVAGILNAAAKTYGGGKYYAVSDPTELKENLVKAFDDIIKRAAAGTAASVLASNEGSGANLIQAVYYPQRAFSDPATGDENIIDWVGRLTNYWYYVDPYYGTSSIREDTNHDQVFNLIEDYIVELEYDTSDEQVEATRSQDTDGDGNADVVVDTVPFEEVRSIWEAGSLLWKRDVENAASADYDARTIYFNVSNTTTPVVVNSTNVSTAATNAELQRLLQAADVNEAADILKFTLGFDVAGYRDRSVAFDLDGNGVYNSVESTRRVWKLGDVINSTPKIVAGSRTNYYEQYNEGSVYNYYYDSAALKDSFTNSTAYKNRAMVFAGGNDGMLHAFKLGDLDTFDVTADKTIANITGSGLGREVWSFVPRNAIPYLKYMAEDSYCHIFTVDLTPFIYDAAINSPAACNPADDYWDCAFAIDSWRTVLIGGMRYGGACQSSGTDCPNVDMDFDGVTDQPSSTNAADCLYTPLADAGYSSYFALDITDPEQPKVLWEFDGGGQLGMASTGPAILRTAPKESDSYPPLAPDGVLNGWDKADNNKNGRWFAMFGSGPTGPIKVDNATRLNSDRQFLGNSNQNLRFFVLDLADGELLRTIDARDASGNVIQKAFAGSLRDSISDSDLDFQDEVIYTGYSYYNSTSARWDRGGVGRILTWESLDPADWTWSVIADGIGPVTARIEKLQQLDRDEFWLYFGTGRLYYKLESDVDDENTQQALYGLKDPCYTDEDGPMPYVSTCDSTSKITINSSTMNDMSDLAAATPDSYLAGWYVLLEPYGQYSVEEDGTIIVYDFGAERVVTDPTTTTSGVVFFTTNVPYADQCDIGGVTYFWALDYETGGSATTKLEGIMLVQTTTGSIEQIDISTTFTERDSRRSAIPLSGLTGSDAPPVSEAPEPDPRVLFIKER